MSEPPIVRVDAETRLRPWRADDATALYRAISGSDDHIAAWMPWAVGYSIGSAHEFLARCLAEYPGGRLDWAVEVTGEVAGGIGVPRFAPEHREYEIGYWLALPYTGRGIMTRSASAVTDLLFR